MTEDVIIATVGAILGGLGVELLRFWKERTKDNKKVITEVQVHQIGDNAKIRQELWQEIAGLREELRESKRELDEWKDKYYQLETKHNRIQLKYEDTLEKLKKLEHLDDV